MNITQLSVFVENKPGHLQNVLKILSEKNINIMTLTIAETSDFGILRMIVNDPEGGAAALKEQHITCSTTDVLALEIDDTPGALYKAVDAFSKIKGKNNDDLNIEYMYAFREMRGDKAVMIFKFDDIESAKEALKKEGYNIVSKIDIIG
ncbi:MAG: ACT domain-containing protein [bacterium]|nr:ACT domain-containing protein [bacterium]